MKMKDLLGAVAVFVASMPLCSNGVSGSEDGVFDRALGDAEPCTDVCEKTYTQHTYDKSLHKTYCQRGCRLFSIIDFAQDEGKTINDTKRDCIDACKESFAAKEDRDACNTGCNNQAPFTLKRQKMAEQSEATVHLLYPLMYVQQVYTSFMSDITRHVSISWSYYLQADDGRVLVMSSQPKIFTEIRNSPKLDVFKTTNYMESSIESNDNSATPLFKNSQIDPDINFSIMDDQSKDWLDCISKKTGVPRLFLMFTILMSACVMIWLSFTISATAPDQKVMSQKLSIYGDLDYMKDGMIKDSSLLWTIIPQDIEEKSEARDVHAKVHVEEMPNIS
ncbi:transmembrane protein 59-like [Tubulanus polymorphus]|uniref:transmembrane protein 59-like n=1 Tax=Tubulanus polymorphus TaxID=672921 RepID=UPI003DA46831